MLDLLLAHYQILLVGKLVEGFTKLNIKVIVFWGFFEYKSANDNLMNW